MLQHLYESHCIHTCRESTYPTTIAFVSCHVNHHNEIGSSIFHLLSLICCLSSAASSASLSSWFAFLCIAFVKQNDRPNNCSELVLFWSFDGFLFSRQKSMKSNEYYHLFSFLLLTLRTLLPLFSLFDFRFCTFTHLWFCCSLLFFLIYFLIFYYFSHRNNLIYIFVTLSLSLFSFALVFVFWLFTSIILFLLRLKRHSSVTTTNKIKIPRIKSHISYYHKHFKQIR